ncbi:MAG: type II toxin-antitoxin system PrlF family antitoxin [Propionibacteriaceae bacterium]|nr:type II toxin-antitoxin system PrlF family antitoxin [Propionibacteriaceae bacterium]
MALATLTSKGQVTIPVSVRKACGLSTGARWGFFVTSEDTIVIRTRTPSLADLCGSLSSNGVHVGVDAMDDAVADAVAEGWSRR